MTRVLTDSPSDPSLLNTTAPASSPSARSPPSGRSLCFADRLAEALGNRSKGLVFDADNQKLEEYLERWLADSVRGSVKP